LIIGVLAKLVMPGRGPSGSMITGIAGAILGGLVGNPLFVSARRLLEPADL